ncbi:MAG: hypothetical protein KAR06_06270 [Deltaproteobacteria bacterium]|nr:hypothetical protein [Deltaproteobacteria bacterium]
MPPREFTPEINEDFYQKLARPIKRRTAANVAGARGAALSRGLEGDSYERGAVSAAQESGDAQLSDLFADIQYRGAGLEREERLTGEGRQFQTGEREAGQEFESAEGEKLRAFQERMGKLGYDRTRDLEALQNRRDYQGAIWSGGAKLALGGVKGLLGKYL